MKADKRIVVILLFAIPFFSCNGVDKNTDGDKIYDEKTRDYNIKYIQEDYTEDDLLPIMGFGSQDVINCSWKISIRELEKQKNKTIIDLINNLDFNMIMNNSEFFINNAFEKRYENRMYFYSLEIVTINDDRYGENRHINRNDWIIILTYKEYGSDFNEKIFMLPDYRIIISSNNYENVD